jgi:glycosyltransferase involved in cell wall biosynthesis
MIVSIVIPMHNAGRWIRATLDSVRSQTFPMRDVELIVVDDQSTDDGPAIVRAFFEETGIAGKIVSHETNGGSSGPRNAGWSAASGEWIQFLDADDILAPGKLALQASHAVRVPADVGVVYSPWRHFELVDGAWQAAGPLVVAAVDDDPVASIVKDRLFGYVGPTLVRRSALPTVGGFNENLKFAEDLDFMLRLAMSGCRFRQVPSDEPTFFYRQTPDSKWRRGFHSAGPTLDFVRFIGRAEAFLRQRGAGQLAEDVRQALTGRYARCLDVLVAARDRDGFEETIEAICRLGVTVSPGMGRSLQVIARWIGFRNAQELRFAYRWTRGAARRVFSWPRAAGAAGLG